MKTLRHSKAGAKLAMAALLAGTALVAISLGARDAAAKSTPTQSEAPRSGGPPAGLKTPDATARDQRPADPEAIAAKRDPQYTSAAGAGTASDEGCLRQRKRLWIEGEGWMIRKVNVCP